MRSTSLLFLLFLPFTALPQNRYDVVIDEIMADPVPLVGLPNHEWIELKNISSSAINLQDWRIGDVSGQSGPLPNFILPPDSFVIVCSASALPALTLFGNAISVTGFPSLGNDGDQLYLQAASGKTIHAVGYHSTWYQNNLKKEGGWTLEMIYPKNSCSGISNWKASISLMGGTPGKRNSVDAINADQTPPRLLNAYLGDSVTAILVFDEPIDSLRGADISSYSIDGGLTIIGATCLPPLFNQVQLKLDRSLAVNMVYSLTGSSNLRDCMDNGIGSFNKAKLGIPIEAQPGEWVINEILFNPRPNAFDYVEFFNNSQKIFDASKLYIANRNSSGIISSIQLLSDLPFYIFPGEHIVVTEDADNLSMNYLVKNPDRVLSISPLPSFPDDRGEVIALNFQGIIIDAVNYKEDWHFRLIENPEAVSLERIDPDGNSQDAGNWHSAASTSGYGTPTYTNSQSRQTMSISTTIEIVPKIFSPDNDGLDDVASVQYKMAETGYVANITVFDVAGRPVRNLVRNGIMGLQGYWNWDGLGEAGKKLPIGIYVVYTEIFNLKGKRERFKLPVVLARKL